jgi:hypothetical protein
MMEIKNDVVGGRNNDAKKRKRVDRFLFELLMYRRVFVNACI